MSYKIAGIDVHKKVLMVVVIDAGRPEEKPERRRFGTMASELRRLSSWLREQGVEEAVMESTAQYWRSVWLELEPYMRLQLAQAFSNRAPRGRKHDFKDAERLVRRLIAEELILSFVPNGEQRTWRNLTRMKTQTQLLCFVHAGCQSSACHPLQAHLVLETGSLFLLQAHLVLEETIRCRGIGSVSFLFTGNEVIPVRRNVEISITLPATSESGTRKVRTPCETDPFPVTWTR